ncbi:Integrase family protein [Sphingobacterium sp. PM2-P1-29]|nr:Integrase family protein [Sphingobacterium sp. PM2-P1-29]
MERIKHELYLLPMVVGTKSKLREDGKGAIKIRITLNCKEEDLFISTNAKPENWLPKQKQVSKNEENHRQINQKIKSVETDLKRIYDRLFIEHDDVTPLMIKRVYQRKPAIEPPKKVKEKENLTLMQAFDQFIAKFGKLVDEGERSGETLKQWKSSKNKVIEFLCFNQEQEGKLNVENEEKEVDIHFPEISPDFGDEMYDYLTLDAKCKVVDATAKKHIKKLKQILKIAVKKKIISENPIADFVCGGDTNEVIPLEWEEVERICRKDFGIDRLNEVADAFVFQCLTGFAYQDLYGLSPENIILVGPQKERWLCKHRGKTGVMEVVPMLPVLEQLIEKYKDHPVCKQRNSLLPILSNTKFNGYLKEIAGICRIPRELHTHLARHTFADLMLNLGMPLEDVGKMLGHKSVRTTQRYARVRKDRIRRNFNKYVRPQIGLSISMIHRSEETEKDLRKEIQEKNKQIGPFKNGFYSTQSSGENYTYSYTLTA